MKSIKNFIIGVFVMVIMLSPLAINAQGLFGSDNFFKVEEYNYNNRASSIIDDNTNPGITNQTFNNQPLPLGSGIAVFVAAGVGYAIMKKRKQH